MLFSSFNLGKTISQSIIKSFHQEMERPVILFSTLYLHFMQNSSQFKQRALPLMTEVIINRQSNCMTLSRNPCFFLIFLSFWQKQVLILLNSYELFSDVFNYFECSHCFWGYFYSLYSRLLSRLRNLISYATQFRAAFAFKLCWSVHSEVLPQHIIRISPSKVHYATPRWNVYWQSEPKPKVGWPWRPDRHCYSLC